MVEWLSALCLTIPIIVIITITVRLIINYLSIHLSNIQSNKRWNDGTLPISISVSISIDDQTARRPGVNEERPFLFLINLSRMLRYSFNIDLRRLQLFSIHVPMCPEESIFQFRKQPYLQPNHTKTPRRKGASPGHPASASDAEFWCPDVRLVCPFGTVDCSCRLDEITNEIGRE